MSIKNIASEVDILLKDIHDPTIKEIIQKILDALDQTHKEIEALKYQSPSDD